MNSFAGIAQQRAPAASPVRRRGIESAPRSIPLDRAAWLDGCVDAVAGRPWRLNPADLIARAGALDVLSYMLGYRAGELERAKGGADALRTD